MVDRPAPSVISSMPDAWPLSSSRAQPRSRRVRGAATAVAENPLAASVSAGACPADTTLPA